MKTTLVYLLIFFSAISFGQSFQWIQHITGINNQIPTGNRITTNSAGESFVVGTFMNQTIIGADTLTSNGIQFTYFAKYSSNGTPIFARKISGTVRVHGNAIAIDKQNNIYIAGAFEGSATFQTTTLYSTGTGAMQDPYVAKYDSNGILIWVEHYSGNNGMQPYSIKTDTLSNVYFTGELAGTRTIGTYNLTALGVYDMFLIKLDSLGTVQWARNYGGNSKVNAYDMTLDNNLNIYTVGHFGDANNGVTLQNVVFGVTTLSTPRINACDIFLAKFDNLGNAIFAKKMGGDYQGDRGFGICYDGVNSLYITGCYEGQAIFGTDTISAIPPTSGYGGAFLARYDLLGNCHWVTKSDSNIDRKSV